MPRSLFLHDREDFPDLVSAVAEERGVLPYLMEKDYWLMHCLYGLQQMGLKFELKGGTSLSKGFGIIERFSEDIDIQIEPPPGVNVSTGRNQDKPAQVKSREDFYAYLAAKIAIPGIIRVERAHEFDDPTGQFRGAGIRLGYASTFTPVAGIKNGVLLEVGFDDTTPNEARDISSWLLDAALKGGIEGITDNRAKAVACYHPGHTFVEKLQAVSTKFRRQQAGGKFPENFLRHYYDLSRLLTHPAVNAFIGTAEYDAHKKKRFRKDDEFVIAKNEAFLFSDQSLREVYKTEWGKIGTLFYTRPHPAFDDVIAAIQKHLDRL